MCPWESEIIPPSCLIHHQTSVLEETTEAHAKQSSSFQSHMSPVSVQISPLSQASVHSDHNQKLHTQYNLLNPGGGEDSPSFGKKASLSSET